MSNLRELYQEMIIDHGRNPRNFCENNHANHIKKGNNPLCGDKLCLFVEEKDGVIINASFQGSGCAISTASASMMTQFLKGKTEEQAREMFALFHDALVNGDQSNKEKLGKLAVFSGVAEFPARVKCATLAWHTLIGALDRTEQIVTTE